jgi:hypothetical protein
VKKEMLTDLNETIKVARGAREEAYREQIWRKKRGYDERAADEEEGRRNTSAVERDDVLKRIHEGRSVCHWMESRVPLITTTLFRPINKRPKQTAVI